MNDIEILEDLAERIKKGMFLEYTPNEYVNAIENLIQRNKDLEQIEKEHKKENGRLREENEVLRYGLRENKILRHGLEENTEEIDKLNVIINLMAEQLTTPVHSKKWVIDYFTNKVEEDK